MPVIRIDFDGTKVLEEEVRSLCEAVQALVATATGVEDTSVYANSPQISYRIAPIEVFVQLSEHKVQDVDQLVATLKTNLHQWKEASNFRWPINLSFIPMKWKIEIDI